jgi:serine/threonine-protein kinase RsbW
VRETARNMSEMGSSGPPSGPHDRQFPRDTSQLGLIRQFVRSSLHQSGIAPTLIDDFELAVSELATNAMQHGAGASVHVRLDVDEGMVSAVVDAETDHPGSIGRVETWRIAPPEAINGRGLGIVAAIMDVVEFSGDHGRAVFRCCGRR